ncbi:DUF4351 domain-containing protein [Thiorhodococcus minor]|uniref:DUF4351 domain-containing protein n=1 Tax=Thiorhodococcus minor TaxID=57489 RepID=A0A6M0K5Y7_9GAMM|nr:DUF4351 domain-containing protein [Thiorhodococcus minor]NEV65162.1 DUF4351 domain-containing protein [Thiorhodococcus minor]
MGHDQNFKNLILDYPRESIQFAAAAEAAGIDRGARILPIRQEQLQERLGERFRELDTPLLVEWPDGRREALLFVFEEETDPSRFSIHRLAHYCLDLAELIGTERVVPVVIFLHRGGYPEELRLGGDAHCYLHFRYLAWPLFGLRARDYFDSPNLVARLNLPNMAYAPEEKLEVYAQAVRGLLTLEPDPERRLKYLDFIDIYAELDDNERQLYQQRYSQEADLMSQFAERFIEQGVQRGVQQGIQQGVQQGEARILLRLLSARFGALPPGVQQKIEAADADTLLHWSERLLSAQTLEDVLH